MKRATRPWSSAAGHGGDKRGRPRKQRVGTEQPSCRWPVEGRGAGATCGKPLVKGLMLCAVHAKVLYGHVGARCAWPGCGQTGVFKTLCSYHDKVAEGLLEPSRS